MVSKNGVLLVKRMLLRDRKSSTSQEQILLRIVFIDHVSSSVWLCRIDDDSWPFRMPIDELTAALDPESGRYTVELNDPWARPGFEHQESSINERHSKRFSLIEPLITGDNERRILHKRERNRLISELLKRGKGFRKHINKLLLRYWKRGMTYEAVRPDFANCGKSKEGVPRKLSGRKVGAPRTVSPGIGINVTDDITPQLKLAADYYLGNRKATIQDALEKIIGLFYSQPIKEKEGEVVGFKVEKDKKPTYRQLQWYIHKTNPEGEIKRRRQGQKHWDLQGRALLGTADGDVQGPGDRFQVDATVADVFLVSQFDRRRIVGRPVIYFVIDVFSRLIVGIYVGFEGPSWVGAMMALVNMVTPKIEFCRQYEITIEESDWPSHHASKRLLADRGELMSVALGKNITQQLRIEIENTSPGRADLKALVERRFGIVPAKFRPFTPGYVEKDFGKRGSRDYRLDAALTLYQFTQLVIYAVLEHNFEPIRNKRLPADMVTDGLTASPLDLWQWGIANRSGSLKILTVDEVSLNVMPSDTARVTEHGFHFKGGYYSSSTALRQEWFSNARAREWNVAVCYDPRNLGIVYLRDPKLPNGYEPCRLRESSGDHDGKSLFELEELARAQKRVEKNGENERQAKRIFFDKQMESITAKAKKATKAVVDPHTPKSAKKANIRAHRAAEKRFQRGAETFDLSDSLTAQGPTSAPSTRRKSRPSNDYLDRELRMLEEKRTRREGKHSEQ